MAILKPHRHLKIALAIFAALLISCTPARAQDSAPVQMFEQKIKAGLLYNLLKYTTWPAGQMEHDRRIQVCLFGGDPFSGYLSPLQGRTAQQYVINIIEIETVSDSGNCNLIFVNRSRAQEFPGLLQSLKGKSILTVSDIDDFSRQGGMVEFSTQNDGHIHLYINKPEIDAAGLTMQNRLLNLAELVKP